MRSACALVPNIELAYLVNPTPHTRSWAQRGAGEVGTVGAPAAIGNAVCHALAGLGVEHLDMPFTPEKVWQALRAGGEYEAQQE